jgi:hypothetical protein
LLIAFLKELLIKIINRMKRLTLIILVAMVPFFTIAQKRSKKNKDKKIENVNVYEFMLITGYQILNSSSPNISEDEMEGPNGAEMQAKLSMSANMDSRVIVVFDSGGLNKNDEVDLSSQQYKSMSEAVNKAGEYGWEFVNANIISEKKIKIHYYYMKRNK